MPFCHHTWRGVIVPLDFFFWFLWLGKQFFVCVCVCVHVLPFLYELTSYVVLVSSVGKVSDYESFQLAVLIICVQVRLGVECAKITHSTREQIAQARVALNIGCNEPFDPRESR